MSQWFVSPKNCLNQYKNTFFCNFSQKSIIQMLLVSLVAISLLLNVFLNILILSSHRWSLFLIRQTVQLSLWRSAIELAIRSFNLLFYFPVPYFTLECAICLNHLLIILLGYRFWKEAYRKKVTLVCALAAQRSSDSPTVETDLLKAINTHNLA